LAQSVPDAERSGCLQAHLADQLHITVLNTVVDHLDEVAGTLITDPVAAGLAIGLGSNGLEDVLDVGPRLSVTTGHDRRAVAGTLLTTGDTGTDKADTLSGQLAAAAVGVGEVGVTTVDDDVAGLEEGEEGVNEVIDSLTGFDEEHDAARPLQLLAQLLQRVGADDRLACAPISMRHDASPPS
jgi:hypothetical protein